MDMAWYIPLLIAGARVCDVSIGTIRTMIVIAGHKYLATALGFVEVIIWVLAVGGTLKYLADPFTIDGALAVLSYAGGFSLGVLCGMAIEDKLAMGFRLVRIVAPRYPANMANEGGGAGVAPEPATPPPVRGPLTAKIRAAGWKVTELEGTGRDGPVEIAFVVCRRRATRELLDLVAQMDAGAFVTVERVDRASNMDHAKGTTPLGSRFRKRFSERPMQVRK